MERSKETVSRQGPSIESLVHRLSEAPEDFVQIAEHDAPNSLLIALVCDHFRRLQAPLPSSNELDHLHPSRAHGKRLSLVALAVWLLRDEWFTERKELAAATAELLCTGFTEIAELIGAQQFVHDPDRREEFARYCLHALHVIPRGETKAQAADRFSALDSVERVRVLRATREAESRARKIREAMARKAAEEAATRYSPE
jgi:hypothetical protein